MMRGSNLHDSIKVIHPLCNEYLLVIDMYILHFKYNKMHLSKNSNLDFVNIIVNTEYQQSQPNIMCLYHIYP